MAAPLPKAKRRAIKAILSNPMYSSFQAQEIAEMFGTSPQTVSRINGEIRQATADAEPFMAQYQQRLLEKLPIAERVDQLVAIAKDKKNPRQLEALKRADDLTGIMTVQEKSRYKHEESEPRPLFALPDGSFPRITVEVETDDAIDVTPQKHTSEIHKKDH